MDLDDRGSRTECLNLFCPRLDAIGRFGASDSGPLLVGPPRPLASAVYAIVVAISEAPFFPLVLAPLSSLYKHLTITRACRLYCAIGVRVIR